MVYELKLKQRKFEVELWDVTKVEFKIYMSNLKLLMPIWNHTYEFEMISNSLQILNIKIVLCSPSFL